jgi:hypothetical protein
MARQTAFRIYGDFAWPPFPSARSSGTRRGVIEIFFVDGGGGDLVAAIEWIPAPSLVGALEPRRELTHPTDEDLALIREGVKGFSSFWATSP